MKKLFTMLVASVCCTMAYAQTISVNDVSVAKGGSGQVEVSIANPTNYTAFQFDLKLPAGVSVKENGAALKGTYEGDTRKLEWKLFNESTNTYRFLSYDMGNAALKADGNVVAAISIEVAETAETGDMTGGEMLVVTSDGTGTATETASGKITVNEGVKIEVPAGKKLMMVSDKALDFTSLESQGVKAFICTGYEVLPDKNRFWMTRINDVPANTPIMVKADAEGNYTVPEGLSNYCYPKSFLSGDASKTVTIDYSADYKYFGVSKSTGSIGGMSEAKQPTVEAGKAYFQVPATIVSNVATEKQKFTLGDGGRLATVSDYDLDFTEMEATGAKAYTVTGFDTNRKVWMTQVSNVNAGTPFVIRGNANQKCEVTSVAGKAAYVNLLDANTGADAVTVSPTIGESTVYVLSLGKGSWGTLAKDWSAAKGKAWMLIPTSFHNSLPTPAATRGGNREITEQVAEVICLEVSGIGDLDDSDVTGISRIAVEDGNDTWYNLSGQRISTPTKKGLYIKNGKKVIVK